MKFKLLIIFLSLSILLLLQTETTIGKIENTTVTNLDFRDVAFSVRTQSEYFSRLNTRGIERLKKAGIYKRKSDQPTLSLILDLTMRPMDDMGCPGKVLYEPRLALVEKVTIPRNELSTWADTWSLQQAASVREPVRIEELERTVDEYLDQFIMAYKMGNPGKEDKS